jgi:hypothetical protein
MEGETLKRRGQEPEAVPVGERTMRELYGH